MLDIGNIIQCTQHFTFNITIRQVYIGGVGRATVSVHLQVAESSANTKNAMFTIQIIGILVTLSITTNGIDQVLCIIIKLVVYQLLQHKYLGPNVDN